LYYKYTKMDFKFYEYRKEVKRFAKNNFKLKEEELDDFVEDILLKATVKQHLFNPEKSAPVTWINNISRNHYIDKYIRKYHPEYSDEIPEKLSTTNEESMDLNAFKESLIGTELYYLFLLKSEDKSVKDICKELCINLQEYNELNKKLKDTWYDFD
jgi:RNA polymerase sigma factor (sigma-70 family)